MKYWICPACSCVNAKDTIRCDGCGLPTEAALLLPTLSWVEFYSVPELDKWIAMMRRMMGAKVWRKT